MSMSSSKQSLVKLAMAHLLSAAKLTASVSAEALSETVRHLSASLRQQNRLATAGPIGKRSPHPIMDTDEADLDTLFIMSFESQAQLEAAAAHMTAVEYLSTDQHGQRWSQLRNCRFTCWED